MASTFGFSLSLSIVLFLPVFALSNGSDCVYTVFIKTGDIKGAGTDSKISLTLYATIGEGVQIKNLKKWGGLMGPNYNYFERGNLDIFSGRGECLFAPPCTMNLTSDGKGSNPGWYCTYVNVTTVGVHYNTCKQEQFAVNQWLALDSKPYKLTAIRDNCP